MKGLIFFLLKGFQMHGTSFVGWLISAAIETVILSLIVGGIAKLCDKDFGEWFQGAFYVIGGIELVLGFIVFLLN